ncbi:hypothetical protein LTS08_003848 [Lithohypha guttulata]|nr:hypothetical protein LTS08_003848 [Lithohypha guttulata]
MKRSFQEDDHRTYPPAIDGQSTTQTGGPSRSIGQRQRRNSRTTNACEQCQRRKTKCSGQPSPCEACEKAELICQFETKPHVRSRLRITYSAEDERLQYLLNGVLNALKHNDDQSLNRLIEALQQDRPPQEIAMHLRHNLDVLQNQGHIPKRDVDDEDLLALASRLDTENRSSQATSEVDTNTEANLSLTESPRASRAGSHGQRQVQVEPGDDLTRNDYLPWNDISVSGHQWNNDAVSMPATAFASHNASMATWLQQQQLATPKPDTSLDQHSASTSILSVDPVLLYARYPSNDHLSRATLPTQDGSIFLTQQTQYGRRWEAPSRAPLGVQSGAAHMQTWPQPLAVPTPDLYQPQYMAQQSGPQGTSPQQFQQGMDTVQDPIDGSSANLLDGSSNEYRHNQQPAGAQDNELCRQQ